MLTGANLDVDIPWKWLNFFLDDDAELKTIGEEYQAGRMLTGQVKKRLIEVNTRYKVGMLTELFGTLH